MSSNWTPDNLTKTNALFNFSFQQTRYFLLVISLNWVKNVITYINILLGYRKLFTIWILKINWRKVSKTRGSWRTERRKKWQIHSYRREFDLMKAHSTYRSRKNWIRENNNDKYMDLPFDLSIVFDFEENVCQSICRWKHSTHAYKFTICFCSLSQKKTFQYRAHSCNLTLIRSLRQGNILMFAIRLFCMFQRSCFVILI